jgi:general L-amino acid transport system permease protein
MALASEAPKDGFRLGKLIYDTRYRSITIQVVFLALFVAFIVWLGLNTIHNLEVKGKDFSFGFLGVRSGYDINQMLVEYTNDSTHARALLVGLLNTLFVAVLGCILATVIGVFAGILRLSKNWLVSRLIGVYIETFRNVPVVIWIVLVFAIMANSMPEPKEFRGENATASMILNDSVAITNRGVYVPAPMFEHGLGWVQLGPVWVQLDILAIIVVLVGSYMGYRALQKRAKVIQEATGVRPVTWWQSLAVLIVPIVALKLALGITFEYPEMKGFNFTGGLLGRNSLIALWLALSIYHATYVAEAVRGGILAISRGQTEASYALGLRPGLTTRLVILPQALRIIIPPLISQYLSITKNSSLAIAVGYMDLRSTLGGITMNQTGRELESMLLLMAIYLSISLIISMIMNAYNSSIKLKER